MLAILRYIELGHVFYGMNVVNSQKYWQTSEVNYDMFIAYMRHLFFHESSHKYSINVNEPLNKLSLDYYFWFHKAR